MSAFVEVKNISFAFVPGEPVLENVSFEIKPGECLGIQGPSGCGKSTLAQIIAGHLKPQSGEILLDGRSVTAKPQRSLFLVHQDSDLFPWLNVERQIAFGMKTSNPAKVAELIRLTKLTGFEKYYPNQLSGGMKKRLSIARALAVNPQLIIFDESFNSLDFELRTEIFRDLKEIWKSTKTTILLISHDPRDIQEIAQREIHLKKRR